MVRFSPLLLALALALGLPGCAGHSRQGNWQRSAERWRALESGPFAPWAKCIDQSARGYFEEGPNTRPRPDWYKDTRYPTDEVIFTWVLADCAAHMRESAWRHMDTDRYERLIADAYRHYFSVIAQIRGGQWEAIT